MRSYCAYCHSKENIICKSHAIPNFYFRNIKVNGSSIVYKSDNSKNALLNMSGDSKLLCTKCESIFNIEFDTPLIQTLSNIIKSNQITPFDSEVITKSLLSIFWRASKSDAEFYMNFNLKSQVEDLFRELMFKKNDVFKSVFNLRVRRIYVVDKSEDPSQVIFSPIGETTIVKRKKNTFNLSGIFVSFGGFHFELYMPQLPIQKGVRAMFASYGVSTRRLYPVNIHEMANAHTMISDMMDKERRGHATTAFKRLKPD